MDATVKSSGPQRQPSVREVFLEALSKPGAAERDAWLDSVCLGKPELRARVDALLRNHREDTFLEKPAIRVEGAVPSRSSSEVSETMGARIYCYKLLEKIGEGGMGVVYLAEQEEPIRRRVALKIIKLGMDTRQVVARFEAERQALALMDHPHIAKVLDAGTTESGRPFFVMELVQGVPVNQFCEEHQLSTEERLKLFIPVCQAIQSAHQKAVIHRDLKPSNVLVKLNPDGSGHPMVIDFGVAKALNQKLTEKTLYTNQVTMIGTPAYMSPEQAEMSGLDVDTRSDIYSLGVLLYELLTGTTPFPEKRLRSVAYAEMQRIILHEEPERPSTRLKETANARSAAQLGTRPSSLAADLDWIVMKCLEKDRNRRYETANGLVADLDRFLRSEPIVARPPSAAYRFQKFVRRHRAVLSASAVVLLALLAVIAVSSWQAVRASHERARAERRLASTLDFVDRMFSGVSEKLQNLIGAATVNQMLNSNGMRLMTELQQEADGNAQFDFALGKLYTQIAFGQGSIGGNTFGNYEASLNTSTQAIQLFARLGDAIPQDERERRLARAEMVAGFAAMALRRYEEGLAHFRDMDKWAKLASQSTNPNLIAEGTKMQRWARGCIGEAIEALGQPENAIRDYYLPLLHEMRSRNVSEHSENYTDLHDLVAAGVTLGRAYNSTGEFDEAERYLRQAEHVLGVMRRRYPNNAQVAAEHPMAEAELGRFLLARTSAEGVKYLESAATSIERLAEQDSANMNFLENRVKVFRLQAQGYAEWSTDPSTSFSEREQRANSAQEYLQRAEALLKSLTAGSLRNVLNIELKDARKQVATAKAKLPLSEGALSPSSQSRK